MLLQTLKAVSSGYLSRIMLFAKSHFKESNIATLWCNCEDTFKTDFKINLFQLKRSLLRNFKSFKKF